MMPILVAFFGHYLADFPVQGLGQPWMKNKHQNLLHLATHVLAYSVTLYAVCSWLPGQVLAWVALNGAMHGVIDFWTSKASHAAWDAKKVWAFWDVIGFDQFLHSVFLLYSGFALGVFT